MNVNERLNISLCNLVTVFVACCRSIYDCICQAHHSMLSFGPRASEQTGEQHKANEHVHESIQMVKCFNVRNVNARFIWMSLNLNLVNWEMPFITILIFTVHQDTARHSQQSQAINYNVASVNERSRYIRSVICEPVRVCVCARVNDERSYRFRRRVQTIYYCLKCFVRFCRYTRTKKDGLVSCIASDPIKNDWLSATTAPAAMKERKAISANGFIILVA